MGTGPSGLASRVPLRQPQDFRRDQDRGRRRHLRHAGRQVRRLPYRGRVHVQVITDSAHHDFTGVQPDPDVNGHAFGALHLGGIRLHRHLHGEYGIARPHSMILTRDRCPEQRHDAVPHDLVDRALVLMDGRHHALQHRVEEVAGLLRVAVGQQLHQGLQVGEQDGDLLALACQGGAGRENLFGQV